MFAYANTDAYVIKQEITQTPDFNGDGISDAVGLPKENVAKNDIRLGSSYDVADGSLKGLSFGGGFTWRQGPIQQFSDHSQRLVVEPGDPARLDLFAAYRTKIRDIDTKFQVDWQNVTDADYLDRRGYFVQPSNVSLGMTFDF
jgi:hypothetical protein